jgi:hypothetical protein
MPMDWMNVHTLIVLENLIFLTPCCEYVSKLSIRAWLIPIVHVTSWNTHKFTMGSKELPYTKNRQIQTSGNITFCSVSSADDGTVVPLWLGPQSLVSDDR